jgi:hypothetical protein
VGSFVIGDREKKYSSRVGKRRRLEDFGVCARLSGGEDKRREVKSAI